MIDWLAIKLQNFGYRLELIKESMRLIKAQKFIPRNFIELCIKSPHRYDDFINLICFLDNNKTINLIDIGTNVGNFTKDFLVFFPNCKEIVCFEPISSLVDEIDKNVNDVRLQIINSALGSSISKKTIKYPKQNSPIASFYEHRKELHRFYSPTNITQENVKVYRLDDMCKSFSKNDNFIVKIDVQGSELEVIKGGMSVLSRASAVIIEASFVPIFKNQQKPSFTEITKQLELAGLFPIIFQEFSKKESLYAFERDIIFVKANLLSKIFFQNYLKQNF
jgi:FkbM family methyltransferase